MKMKSYRVDIDVVQDGKLKKKATDKIEEILQRELEELDVIGSVHATKVKKKN